MCVCVCVCVCGVCVYLPVHNTNSPCFTWDLDKTNPWPRTHSLPPPPSPTQRPAPQRYVDELVGRYLDPHSPPQRWLQESVRADALPACQLLPGEQEVERGGGGAGRRRSGEGGGGVCVVVCGGGGGVCVFVCGGGRCVHDSQEQPATRRRKGACVCLGVCAWVCVGL